MLDYLTGSVAQEAVRELSLRLAIERYLEAQAKIRRIRWESLLKFGDTMMVWDYANNEAVPESEMQLGSDRRNASERAKWAALTGGRALVEAWRETL